MRKIELLSDDQLLNLIISREEEVKTARSVKRRADLLRNLRRLKAEEKRRKNERKKNT